jgi:hypothetical protein
VIKIEVPWRRTGKNQYPQQNQLCLVYFFFTKFSISKYEEEPGTIDFGAGTDYVLHVFSDAGGFLTDEDLLWIPITELPAVGSFASIAIPEDYLKEMAPDRS